MTASIYDIQITQDKITRKQFPLAAGQHAHQGATACGKPSLNACVEATSGDSTLIMLGVFAEDVDNSAGNATTPVNVDFLYERTILWRSNDGTVSAATCFHPAYQLDNQTVTSTPGSNAVAGTILEVDPVLGVGFVVGGF